MKLSEKNILNLLFILLLVADIDYSFRQHEHKALDGDMSLITAPSKSYTAILEEPFGLKAALHHEKYAGSNRYYAHQAMIIYYKHVYPAFAYFFNDKVDCLYKFTGLFHLLIQILITLLLVYYALKNEKPDGNKVLFLILLVSSLFQTNGYAHSIGVIDHSVTYTFFYAMPLTGLLFFLLPYLRWNIESKTVRQQMIYAVIWIPFAFTLSMSGAIIPPLGCMIGGTVWLYVIIKTLNQRQFQNEKPPLERSIPYFSIITLSVFLICCIYSYYVGMYNTENSVYVPLAFRYERLIEGLKSYFIHDISFLLLGLILTVNFILIKRNKIKITFYVWIMLALSVCFILLLPFGGYRPYRPNIIRNDTFLPVILLLFYFVAKSSSIVLCRIEYSKKYVVFLAIVMLIFTYADKPNFKGDRCQRSQIKRLQQSKEKITILPADCPILTWDCTKDTQWTIDGSRMLYFWGITDTVKIYRHE